MSGNPNFQQYKPKAALQRARNLEKIGNMRDACDYLFEVLTSKRMGRCVQSLDSVAAGMTFTVVGGNCRRAVQSTLKMDPALRPSSHSRPLQLFHARP
jgi:hypothetical protein